MVTFTPNRGLSLPAVGDDIDIWGGEQNSATAVLDNILGGVVSISVAGNSNVNVTAPQSQYMSQKLTGALTGDINLVFPATGGFYFVNNTSSGAFTITALTSALGSAGVVLPRGVATFIWSDGVNVYTNAIPPNTTLGTATNDNAAAGYVGEYASSTVLAGAAVALPDSAWADVTSISLSAGDWDVWGSVFLNFGGASGSGVLFAAAIAEFAGAPSPAPNGGGFTTTEFSSYSNISDVGQTAGARRLSLATTTTIYLATFVGWDGAFPCSGYGFIGARRVR